MWKTKGIGAHRQPHLKHIALIMCTIVNLLLLLYYYYCIITILIIIIDMMIISYCIVAVKLQITPALKR